ncbi:stage II sporulation protein D [Carboxydocella thermautotrophica]|nr:stage II sporulation protein D [Carboxydocella thermautotrophica]
MRKGGLFLLLLTTILFLLPIIIGWMLYRQEPGLPGPEIKIYSHREQKVLTLSLEEYVVGVVGAEMPAAFHPEALKAQAVAARTYAWERLQRAGELGDFAHDHGGAVLCDDPTHTMAWLEEKEILAKWPRSQAGRYYQKIREAVSATAGQILLYQGKPIQALFHASCSGLGTESALEVRGQDIPYLAGAACPKTEAQDFPPQRQRVPAAISVLSTSQHGTVLQAQVNDRSVAGREIRNRFQLPSARFRVLEVRAGVSLLEISGYGHGLGLCQRGANLWSQQGWDYQRILQHYYQGTEIKKLY